MQSNWVGKSSLPSIPLRNWTPWWMKLKISPDRLCYVWLLSPVYWSRNLRCWFNGRWWKYWRRRWRWMGRSICSIGWEKWFWHVWWRDVNQIVIVSLCSQNFFNMVHSRKFMFAKREILRIFLFAKVSVHASFFLWSSSMKNYLSKQK